MPTKVDLLGSPRTYQLNTSFEAVLVLVQVVLELDRFVLFQFDLFTKAAYVGAWQGSFSI